MLPQIDSQVEVGVALLMQAHPNISAAQLKIALQTGSTYMWDGGLMGGGAGSANFWASRKIAANGLTNLVSTVVGGLVTPTANMVFWDAGTMMKRLYRGNGLRVLSLLEAPLAWLSGSYLRWGDLNLLGLTNPLAQVGAMELMWGDVSDWTDNQELMWGDHVYNPEGQELMWGDNRTIEGEELMWGDSAYGDQ